MQRTASRLCFDASRRISPGMPMHERVELLTVEDTFWIEGNGVAMLVLHPDFSVPKRGWSERTEEVVITKPNGDQIHATAKIGLTHLNIRDPDVPIDRRWRITVWLTDRSKEEVPVGSRILVSPELREALVPQDAGSHRA